MSKGFQLASAAAALAFSAVAIAANAPAGSSGKAVAAADTVHCYGVSCKGQGFKGIAAAQCLKDGGTIGDL